MFTPNQIQPSDSSTTICLVLTSLTVSQLWLFQPYAHITHNYLQNFSVYHLYTFMGWRPIIQVTTNYNISKERLVTLIALKRLPIG